MKYYLDTNIFLYSANPNDLHHKSCKRVLELIAKGELETLTSTLTFEEIIFYAQKSNNVQGGLKICKWMMLSRTTKADLSSQTIEEFFGLVDKYPKIRSADLIHAATCVSNGVRVIISVDRDFDKIKEIRRIDPADFP